METQNENKDVKKRHTSCLLCGADDFTVLFPEGMAQKQQIVRCNVCKFIYANPQIIESVDGKINLDDLPSNEGLEEKMKGYLPENIPYLKKQFLQIKDYRKVLNFLKNFEFGKSPILLDVGSFAGVFLNEARSFGWDVLGIEPLRLPRAYSERMFGLKIFPETLENVKIEKGSIDVITSFHVVEHVYDLNSFIQKKKELLKKGGILIIETPTYDTLSYFLLRHRERSMRCEGHMTFFTKKTLRKLLENHKFEVIKHERVGRTLTLGRLLYNIAIMMGVDFKIPPSFEKISFTLNIGDIQRIYSVKL